MITRKQFVDHVGHPHDWEFFYKYTHHAPSEMLFAIISEYRRAREDAWDDEPSDIRKEGAARRAANTLLREDAEAMKAREPEVLRKYREIVENGPPQVCHSCDHYTDKGWCRHYDAQPPEDFAATPDACPSWVMAPPF